LYNIIGYCANALYLWAIAQECQLVNMNINNQLIGFVQVDIETPEDLKEKFSEMTPIFKNAEIKFDDIDEYMQNYHNYNDIPFNKPKKNIYNE
jgi:hypothetical protein